MDEQERKRKREEEHDESVELGGIEQEQPREGLSLRTDGRKKQKRANDQKSGDALESSSQDPALDVAERRRAKRDRKKAERQEEIARKAAKKEATKKARVARKEAKKTAASKTALYQEEALGGTDDEGLVEDKAESVGFGRAASPFVALGVAESPASPVSKPHSPTFDPPHDVSGTSSISSIANNSHEPSTEAAEPAKPPVEQSIDAALTDEPSACSSDLRERLLKRIAELRLARKADNEDGVPVRTRAELLEQRRQKAERKAARKKQLRQQAKEEEARQRATALAHGSPLLSPSGEPPPPEEEDDHDEPEATNFSFGRIAFDDGAALATHDLSGLLDKDKRKGPRDAKSALVAAQARQERLAALDPAQRAKIEEKEAWLNARKRAQGERVRDDPALLKKTVKRKEGKKRKSEREWQERSEGVKKGREARQAKRDQNIKNKKQRGKNGKREGSGGKGKGGGKKKPRPGFEGSFKAGSKRS